MFKIRFRHYHPWTNGDYWFIASMISPWKWLKKTVLKKVNKTLTKHPKIGYTLNTTKKRKKKESLFQKETKPMSLNKFFAFEIFKLSTSRECKRVTSKKMHSKAQTKILWISLCWFYYCLCVLDTAQIVEATSWTV